MQNLVFTCICMIFTLNNSVAAVAALVDGTLTHEILQRVLLRGQNEQKAIKPKLYLHWPE